ncbi:MAG: MerR family transcriptional regulator [Proteobacteria bacterium]|nr:MerR family transcriptional regulator [Pseudomonadota bacterium]MBU1709462.1 MerR family transcriptional regulator [Pseudomonadota bacterium]
MGTETSQSIPEKNYFKISEVCRLTGVKQHVLRYWESEFAIIKPQRASSKQRLYRKVDVENILRIKRLLKVEGFTIPGARKFLAENLEPQPKIQSGNQIESKKQLFREIKTELADLKSLLEKSKED